MRCVPRRREPFLRVGHKTQNRHTQTANFTGTGTVLMKNLNRQLLLPVRTTGIPFDRFNNTGESRDHTRDTRDTRITLVTGIPYGISECAYLTILCSSCKENIDILSTATIHPPGSPRSSPLPRISIQCMCACLGGVGASPLAPGPRRRVRFTQHDAARALLGSDCDSVA